MKILVGVLALVSCVSLALHFVDDSEPVDSDDLTLDLLAKGLGYSWYPVDLESLGGAKMIGVGRSEGDGFRGGSSSRPGDLEEPMFLFYKREDGEIHYSIVSRSWRTNGAIPIGGELQGGTMISKPAGMVIKAGEAFVTLSEPETGAAFPPDYEAGNVAFGIFAK